MADSINEHVARAVSRLGSGRADRKFRMRRDEAEKEWKANGGGQGGQGGAQGGGKGGGGGAPGQTPVLNTPGGGPAGARIPIRPVGGAPLQSGMVVDTFMEGPNNFAIERYQLNGAEPNTTYQVNLVISLFVPDCSGQAIIQPSVPVTTNAQGNGQASIRVPPEFIPAIAKGQTNSLHWQFLNNGVVRYDTECVAIYEDLDDSHGLEG
ncbi:MAG TPA: hypothetical protein VFR81_03935 [Longimicrobium sp.]|nr:hypothetical protein [Longimicrobium sp.]